MRRFLKILLALILTLGLVFYVGGGWYFSSVFRTDALESNPWPQYFETEVVSVDDAVITLTETGTHEDEELLDPGVFGLRWSTGYGQIGPFVENDGTLVTREFVRVGGEDPTPGTLTDVEPTAFADPGALGRTWAVVDYESQLGPMEAWQVDGDGSTWVIVVHGKGAGIDEGMRMLSALSPANLPTLLISYRNDQGEPADPSGFYRYGQTEWQDLQSAINYAGSQGAEDVVLAGLSTGAAVILSYLEQVDDGPTVMGLLFDSPNIDFGTTVDYNAAQRTIPGIGMKLPQSLTSVAKWMASWRFDIDWNSIDYINENLQPIPMLVFHGSGDLTVPVETSRRLADAMPETTRLVVVGGAQHVGSWNANPREYVRHVAEFLASLGI